MDALSFLHFMDLIYAIKPEGNIEIVGARSEILGD